MGATRQRACSHTNRAKPDAYSGMCAFAFGMRAKSIKNKVKQNAERSAKELLMELNKAEAKIGRISDLVAMIQAKLKQVIAEAPDDVQEAYQKFIDEAMHIATAKDLDFLLAQLKGDKSDLLLQAVEEA